MGRNQRVQLDVVVGWRILPVGSVEILQAEQMFLQSSLLVLLAAHLDVLPAPWIPAGLHGVPPPDVGPVFGPSRPTTPTCSLITCRVFVLGCVEQCTTQP